MPELDFLNKLGTKKTNEGISLNNVEAVLYEFANDFISEAKKNLEKTGSVASGALSDSIKFLPISFAGSTYKLQVSLLDYYDFINKGVSGTQNKFNTPYSFKNIHPSKAMVEAIKGWLAQGKLKSSHRDIKRYGTYGKLEKKNVSITPSPERSLRSTAYAVATSVKKKGIKPTHFFDNAFIKTYPQLKKDLAKALKEDFRIVIRNINTE